jgi:hypothetical protein
MRIPRGLGEDSLRKGARIAKDIGHFSFLGVLCAFARGKNARKDARSAQKKPVNSLCVLGGFARNCPLNLLAEAH